MRIALVGTRGAPALYGGFETAVEEVGKRLAARGHDVTVYCRNPEQTMTEYAGMRLVNLPALRKKALETLSHSALSSLHHLAHRADVALVFNAANAPFLPLFRLAGVPVALHVDGLEWRRAKWGPTGRRYYLACERLAVRLADELIADAVGIQDYYQDRYGAHSVYIAYGAPILRDAPTDRLAEVELAPHGYHLVVARLEPENNVDAVMLGYTGSRAELPLVVVGSVPHTSPHLQRLQGIAAEDARIRMLGGVYDQELLDQLYAGCASYLHGHSVGGTNPSLLRAMGAAAPVLAIDVNFTREVLGETGRFWATPPEVTRLVEDVETHPATERARGRHGQRLAAERFRWDDVADRYEKLCDDLAGRARRARRGKGR